jgi:acetylornithine deacetylase/succinyl-diaminopimelate desuccinylase-like protein
MNIYNFFNIVDQNKESLLQEVRSFLRMPSISGTGEGIEETARFLRDWLHTKLGADVQLLRYGGHPIVYGYLDENAEHTLIYYNMYDVQPVDPLDKWIAQPFEAKIIENKIVARGALNTKGSLMSGLLGMELFKKENGRLPMNIIFVLEGEEELGSPSMPRLVEDKKSELANASVAYFAFPTETLISKPKVILGNKGIMFVEINVKTSQYDVHSSLGRGLYNPAVILSKIVSSLIDPLKGPIVDWLEEDVITPTSKDLQYLDEIKEASPIEVVKELYGIKETRLSDEELYIEVYFKPNINVDGFTSGYTGPGPKTIVPGEGKLRLDFRLVPNMDGKKIYDNFINHLKKLGVSRYIDVKLHDLYPWSKTDPDSIVANSARKAYSMIGMKPYTIPMLPGSAPMYLFTHVLNVHAVAAGPGHGGRAHAPNEYITIETVPGIAKYTMAFISICSEAL